MVRVPVDALKLWPGNPRRGNRTAIRESIRVNGIYKPLLVWSATGEVLAGNNTLIAARELGHTHVDVIYKDVDEATARRINLVDNKASDGSGYDDELLREALLAMDELTGTGWSAEELDALMQAAEADETAAFQMDLDGGGGVGDEDVLVLEDVRTGADWAELPQQEAARGERQAAQVVSEIKGTREIMLVYTRAEHEEMIALLDGLKRAGGGELRYPQIVQRLVRGAAREAGLV